MNYNILDSLQHITTAKIAIAVFYDNEIEKILLEERKYPQGMLSIEFNLSRHELWKLIQIKTFKKTVCLPAMLQTKVCNYIHALHIEVEDWSREHTRLLDLDRSQCRLLFKNILCWKSNGTINRVETAKKIAQDTSIDPNIRFIVACTYFLEDELLAIWYGNKNVNKKTLRRKGTNSAVRFWMKWLRKGSCSPWRPLVNDYFSFPCVRRLDIPLRLSAFFPYLSQEYKLGYFENLDKHEFFLYLRELEDTESTQLLRRNPQTALYYCLQFRFQTLFIDIVKKLESLGEVVDFEILFHKIISHIIRGLRDIDYVELLKELWSCSPSFIDEVKQSIKFSNMMEILLNHDADSQLLSLEEMLSNCKHSKKKY